MENLGYNANISASEQKVIDAMIENQKSTLKNFIIELQTLKIRSLENCELMAKYLVNAIFNLGDRFACEFDGDEMAQDIIKTASTFDKVRKSIETNNIEADALISMNSEQLGKLSNHYLLLNRFNVN